MLSAVLRSAISGKVLQAPPTPLKNLLIWTITGSLNQKSNSSGSNSHSTNFLDLNDQEDANLTELVEKFWKVEGSGIQEYQKATFSDKSKR